MKNGFYHERPTDEDIFVSQSMQEELGTDSINGHVTNARYEGRNIVADCQYNGKVYKAESRQYGATQYWQIIPS